MKKRKKIPKRMLAIAALVDHSKVLADVGCDHAYISINLLENGKADRIIASDLREGPLKTAKDNINLTDFKDRIDTRLCPGLEGFEAGEVDTVLISGMVDEDMLKESGKYYQIMKAVRSETGQVSGNDIGLMAEDEFGPVLIRKKHPVLKEFLLNRKAHFEALLQNKEFIESQKDSENDRITVIDKELKMVTAALSRF